MNTSDGGNASRRDSISHTQPVVYESPSCRRTNGENADAPTTTAMTPTSHPIRLERTSKSYAHEQDRKHVCSLMRRRSNKSHRPRQSSNPDTTQLPPVSSFSRGPVTLTDVDIDNQLLQLLDQEAAMGEDDMVISYAKASPVPPITHESLSELDIARIINNPKLRHDVNFDKELHFRPNMDGSRGRQKLRAADDYWNALTAELVLYGAVGAKLLSCTTTPDQEYWARMMRASHKRMPIMFETIRDILKTLVPDRDQTVVAERLDVSMIMQEISRGVFDMMSLAHWLSALLKAHCAPMRDEWIDQMVAQVQSGVQNNCQKRIVLGLRQLLGILEAMKLDVANHQIRHLRAMLIEDGVNFQTKYHLTRMHYGRLDITRATRWFLREDSQRLSATSQPDKLNVFISALFKSLLSQSSLSSLPETFSLDSDRLRALRADLHNLVHVQICIDVFETLLSPSIAKDARNKAVAALKTSLTSIVGDTRRHVDCAGNVAVEMVRLVLAAEGSTLTFDAARTELVEERLRVDLQPSSLAFARRNKQLFEAQMPALEKLVREHILLTPLTLHDRMFAPLTAAAALTGASTDGSDATQQAKSIEAVLRRLCHVAILHWHIWSPIAYEVATIGAGPLSPSTSIYDSDGTSTSGSDTDSEAGSDVSEISSATEASSSTKKGGVTKPGDPSKRTGPL